MNIEKSQMKNLIANNLGASIEDRLEGSMRTAHELAGASSALKQAARKVPTDLAAKADDDESFRDGMEATEVRGLVKKYLGRVGEYLSHLSDVEQQKAITQSGRSDGLREAMEIVKKVRDQETKKIQAVMSMLDKVKNKHGTQDAEVTGNEPEDIPRTAAEAARMANGSLSERREEAKSTKTATKPAKKKAVQKKARTRKVGNK